MPGPPPPLPPPGTGGSDRAEPVEGDDVLRRAAALVYVDDMEAPTLSLEDAHHLAKVLRLRRGETIVVSDGAGLHRQCHLESDDDPGGQRAGGQRAGGQRAGGQRAGRRRSSEAAAVSLVPITPIAEAERAVPEVGVGFSVAKGDRTEWAVAKLTELGVDRIMPLLCERTVAKPPTAERLARIAREAAMQSRRLFLPEVMPPATPTQALVACGGTVALAEPGGPVPGMDTRCVFVGPEGGWSEAELHLAASVGLGATILRIETAAVVAGALLTALRGGLVSPSRVGVPAASNYSEW